MCGAVPSPDDPRDFGIDMLLPPMSSVPAFPREFTLVRPKTIRDQGRVGSCVGFTLATSKEIIEAMQGKSVEMSPGFIYGNRSGNYRHQWTGAGMYPRDALTSLRNDGTPRLEVFPFNEEVPDIITRVRNVTGQLRPQSFPFRITAFARLMTVDQVKTALTTLGPVPISYTLFESFNRVGRNGIVPNPAAREVQRGGHAMVCIGWRVINGVEYWIIVNSWGQHWGDGGLCYIATSQGYNFREAWSMTDTVLPARRDMIRVATFRPAAATASEVILDGNPFILPTPTVLQDDRILVPLRFFSEVFGCHVQWNDAERSITISRDNNVIRMTLGSRDFTVNGNNFSMDTAPFVVEPGFTMVPVRFVSEHLNSTVEWNPTTGVATVTRRD
jgi:hypothetical protein